MHKYFRYNVCLIGIGKLDEELNSGSFTIEQNIGEQKNMLSNSNIYLNPGNNYKILADDVCFYISLVKEENFEMKVIKQKTCMFSRIFNQI